MQPNRDKEQVLSQYENEGNGIISILLNVLARAQKKIDRQKYFETLEQIQKKK